MLMWMEYYWEFALFTRMKMWWRLLRPHRWSPPQCSIDCESLVGDIRAVIKEVNRNWTLVVYGVTMGLQYALMTVS